MIQVFSYKDHSLVATIPDTNWLLDNGYTKTVVPDVWLSPDNTIVYLDFTHIN